MPSLTNEDSKLQNSDNDNNNIGVIHTDRTENGSKHNSKHYTEGISFRCYKYKFILQYIDCH